MMANINGAANMPDPTIEQLKQELHKVRQERDHYRQALNDLLTRLQCDDLEKEEAELRDWIRGGRMSDGTIDEVLHELESKLGPAA